MSDPAGEIPRTFKFPLVNRPNVIVTIDEDDVPLVSQYRWRGSQQCEGAPWYAIAPIVSNGRKTTLYLHRLIMGAKRGQIVDHADRDSLNNTRANLRFCTPAQSSANRVFKPGLWRYRGVSPSKKRWKASIESEGSVYFLGMFPSPEDAAVAYDIAATRLHGEFAITNAKLFPDVFSKLNP